MTTEELQTIRARAEAALEYEPSAWDEEQGCYVSDGTGKDDHFHCPLCDGDGSIEGQRYDDKGKYAATIVAYGIGEGLRLAEAWVESGPRDTLALLAEVERLRNVCDRYRTELAEALTTLDEAHAHTCELSDNIEKLKAERDEADADARLADTRLAEIVELVGKGGDGSAFGSVESMLSTHRELEQEWVKQRAEAVARVGTLRELADEVAAEQGLAQRRMMEAQEARETAFARGAEAMREKAAGWAIDNEMHHPEWCAKNIRALPLPKEDR